MGKSLILHQRYRVIEKLGAGGFSDVYLALDQQTNSECVIKHLLSRRVDNVKSIQLFEREAKILSNLKHSSIPRFIDYFTVEANEDVGGFYLVQEKIEGKTLQQLVEGGMHFSENDAVRITLEVVKVLGYLHSLSPPVIHRDIKPSNIIVTPSKQVYLIDFGAVKDSVSLYGTGSTLVVGTGGYMSLEQLQGRAEPGSDIYSLGMSLVFLLSHKHPTEIEQQNEQLKFLPYVNISKDFAKVLKKMIQPALKRRYRTSVQLKVDLEGLLSPSGSVAGIASVFFKKVMGLMKPGGLMKHAPETVGSLGVGEEVDPGQLMEYDLDWGFVTGEFVRIAAGEFMMGSENGLDDEKPVHKVIISKDFEMSRYQITQQQWQVVMGDNPGSFKGDSLPVESVSWRDVQRFIAKLNAKSRKYTYTLPTEAQWEYACRAGTIGDYAGNLDSMAWYRQNSNNEVHPVGLKRPNAWGLYDMHGNVHEWCLDWYGSYSIATATDPVGVSLGSDRVVRGGGWGANAFSCRSARRGINAPGGCYNGVGFRLVRAALTLEPSSGQLMLSDVSWGQVVGEFVYIAAGEFMMGSGEYDWEKPVHKVIIAKGFEIGKYQVTQKQWEAVMGFNPSEIEGENLPVVTVSWDDVQEFIIKLNAKSKEYIYRLPTEAEWEYACRAGTTGDYAGNLDDMAWYYCEDGLQAVGQKQPNGWGLYDMHGNVWEWCSDWFGDYLDGTVIDPKGVSLGSRRISRGGSWTAKADVCRSAERYSSLPNERGCDIGFRLVRVLK